MTNPISQMFKGIALSILIGLVAYGVAPFIPSMNEILMGLLLGVLFNNLVRIPNEFQSGTSFMSSKMFEIAILLLAVGINFSHISNLGWRMFLLLVLAVFGTLFIGMWLSKKLKCPGSSGLLISFGTVICGAAAIAALAPFVSKNKEEIGISMAVINLFGILGMLLFPLILVVIALPSQESGLLIGGSLHSVGNVAGAGFEMGEEVGRTAITVKLARVALLSPALLLVTFLYQNAGNQSKTRFRLRLPWYVWGFILISIFVSVVPIPSLIIKLADDIGKFVLTVAMSAVGLNVRFITLYQSGRKGLLLGLILFWVQIAFLSFWFFI